MPASSLRSPIVAALVVVGALIAAAPASAQSASCQDAQKFMGERQNLIQQLNKSGGKDKKLDPRVACSSFGKLIANGENGLKWIEANKDWCQIPDQFAQSFKEEHDKIKELRGQACKAAAQVTQMEKQAREGANPFAGGLTGQYKIPQGAL
jgi:hypothetical protein